MPSARKKPALKLDRFNERAQAEFIPASEGDNHQNQYFLALDAIADRPGGDTRLLNPNHVNALSESILVLGLISPLTVDRKGHLLAGGHRRAALIKISVEQPERFAEQFPQGIPVRVMDLDAQSDEVDALQIEVEENTQRRNFTAAEIREAAKRLENAGYTKLRGRPRPGQKSLKRELATVFRLSEDRIQRILNDSEQKGRRTPTFSPDDAIDILERWLKEIGESPESPELMKATKQMQTLVKQLHRCHE
jgi:ParB family transcriptional regulator, chromosome partitioning protein